MKKMLFGTFLWMFALAGVAVLPNYANAQSGWWENPSADANLLGDGTQRLSGSTLLTTVKNAINWIMGILATIALVICLYGGFKMITSAGDDKKYEDGMKVLKNAAIWLAIIGLSWMIVSVIFRFIGTLGWGGQTKVGSTSNASNNGSLVN